jgi:hypothetical protein
MRDNPRKQQFFAHVEELKLVLHNPGRVSTLSSLRKEYSFFSSSLYDEMRGEMADRNLIVETDVMLMYLLNYCVFPNVHTLHLESSIIRQMHFSWYLLQRVLSSAIFPVLKHVIINWREQRCLDLLLFGEYLDSFDHSDIHWLVNVPAHYQHSPEEEEDYQNKLANIWQLPDTVESISFHRLDITSANENEFLCFLQFNNSLKKIEIKDSIPGFNPLYAHLYHMKCHPRPELPSISNLSVSRFPSASKMLTSLFYKSLISLTLAHNIGEDVLFWKLLSKDNFVCPKLEEMHLLDIAMNETHLPSNIAHNSLQFATFKNVSQFPSLHTLMLTNCIGALSLLFHDTPVEAVDSTPVVEHTTLFQLTSLSLDFSTSSCSSAIRCFNPELKFRFPPFPKMRHLNLSRIAMTWDQFYNLWSTVPEMSKLESMTLEIIFVDEPSEHSSPLNLNLSEPLTAMNYLCLMWHITSSGESHSSLKKDSTPAYMSVDQLSTLFPNIHEATLKNVFPALTGSEIEQLIMNWPHLHSLAIEDIKILSLPFAEEPCTYRLTAPHVFRRFTKLHLQYVDVSSMLLGKLESELPAAVRNHTLKLLQYFSTSRNIFLHWQISSNSMSVQDAKKLQFDCQEALRGCCSQEFESKHIQVLIECVD